MAAAFSCTTSLAHELSSETVSAAATRRKVKKRTSVSFGSACPGENQTTGAALEGFGSSAPCS
jgi:hypothetical protein